MAPIRPIEENGKWGCKQHRIYELDEDGNRLLDADGNYVFNAVPTTDWGSTETLEYWREQWAAMCNAKFEEKGLPERIDHSAGLAERSQNGMTEIMPFPENNCETVLLDRSERTVFFVSHEKLGIVR